MPHVSIVQFWPAIVLALGIFSGCLLSIRLWTLRSGPVLANHILGLTMSVITCMVGIALLMFSSYLSFSSLTFKVAGAISFSYAPLIYLYFQASIRKDFSFKWRQLLHFVAPLFLLALTFAEVIFAQEVEAPPIGLGLHELPLRIILGLIVILLFISTYCFLSVRSLYLHRRFVLEHSSFSDDLHSKWLVFLFPIFLLPFLFAIFNSLFMEPFQLPLPAIGSSLMLVTLLVLMIFSPQAFAGFPADLRAEQEADLFPAKYQSSSLEESQKDRLHTQVMAFMTEQQAYLRQDLTLQQLADGLSINNKYLSQVINERSGKHFMDFVNEYRVNRAKEILLKPSYKHYTIVAIAQEVGFKSRSAFYAAFKKFTGQTPSEYRAAQCATDQ